MSDDVSTKGLDNFARKFLIPDAPPGEDEYVNIQTQDGQKLSPDTMNKFAQTRMEDFIKRAGGFTEDLIAFINEQKMLRNLSDTDAIFGLALANINLRNAYGSPQGTEETLTDEQRQTYLEQFDEICCAAQEYWDAHAEEE